MAPVNVDVANKPTRSDYLSGRLIDHLATQTSAALPNDIIELTKLCVMDYLGCALAGASDDGVRILFEQAASEGQGNCTVLGQTKRLSGLQAALVNAAAGHALDFDDCALMVPGHLTVAILPAMFAIAEQNQITGINFIKAFVFAYEFGCRVSKVVEPGHYSRGFHSTATIGSIAAAVACSRILELSPHQTETAIGIAATQAAGLKCMFGTMCKTLHAGKAAQNGLYSALLASRGFESRGDVIEAPQGFAAVMSTTCAVEAAIESEPGHFYLRDNLFKLHASCSGTHGAIEATRLISELLTSPADVRHIIVRVGQENARICNIAVPKTGNEAKFSLRLMVSYALLGIDTGSLASFKNETVNDPNITMVRDMVTVCPQQGLSIAEAHVEVECLGGRVLSRYSDGKRNRDDDVSIRPTLEKKFCGLTAESLGLSASQRVIRVMSALELAELIGSLLSLLSTEAILPSPQGA